MAQSNTGLSVGKPKKIPARPKLNPEDIKSEWRKCFQKIVKLESLPYFKDQKIICKRLYAEKRRLESLLHEQE